eukprot:TRINITY_DN93422_c0_g1_i1.p1 TRINITY_DN93422_c0_g1~~TRINITY_DN93422_c0_g1_i1.p1  ORF type:complete len:208 (-),score=17.46 TRINITY_DN93422_c0_g1_i1:254-877(-)
MDVILEFDKRCTGMVHHCAWGYLEYALLPGATLFGWTGIFPVLAGVYLLGDSGCLWYGISTLALGQVTNRFMKVFLQRQRPTPPDDVPRVVKIRLPKPSMDPDGASFPSGDTMAGAAVGAVLALSGHGQAWWLLGLYAGFGRVYFWAHYILDVLGGYAVGSGSAALVGYLSSTGDLLTWKHVAAMVLPFYGSMKALKKLQQKMVAKD